MIISGGQPDVQQLVMRSSLIFAGTTVALGASSVANLPPRDNLAVVRVDRPLRSDPALGDLHGKPVTVELRNRSEWRTGETAVFFTSDWIHGGGIAAREIAHVEVDQEDTVTREVRLLPERHLAERLADAVLVVAAEVTAVEPTPFDIRWRNAPQWAAASLGILEVLRGQPGQATTVLFPTSRRPTWLLSPRLSKGQSAIFILHRPQAWPPLPEPEQMRTAQVFTALDPADVQPLSQRPTVEKLLNQGSIG